MLKINISENPSGTLLALEGKLNADTSKELKSRLSEIPEDVTRIELDLENLIYTSSAGLRVILQLHNQLNERGGKLTVSRANETIREVFDDTGLSGCLNLIG